MLQVIRSIFWILLFPSATNGDSAVLVGGLVSLKNTSCYGPLMKTTSTKLYLKWNVIYDALTAMNRSQTSRYQEEEVGWLSCGQLKGTNTDFAPSTLQVIRSIFWILLFPSATNGDSAVLLVGLVSLKNTSSVVLAVLIYSADSTASFDSKYNRA
jgi:hypothetical protein